MYSIIDIESNGDGYRHECIIDIAIFKFDGHRVVDQFMSLVNHTLCTKIDKNYSKNCKNST